MKGDNNFDELIRQSLENHQVDMPASSWSNMQQKLDATPGKGFWNTGTIAASIALVAGIGTAVVLLTSGSDKAREQQAPQVVETTNTEKTTRPVQAGTVDNEITVPAENHSNAATSQVAEIADVTEQQPAEIHTEPHTTHTSTTTSYATWMPESIPSKPAGELDSIETPETQTELVRPVAPSALSLSTLEVCQGQSVAFQVKGGKLSNVQVTVDGMPAETNGNEIRITQPGIHTIAITGINAAGKETQIAESVTVLSAETPVVRVYQPNNASRPFHRFATNATGDIQWQINAESFTGVEAEYLFRKAGQYDVVCTTTADNGCVVTGKSNIDVPTDYNLLAPNSFSPNGDGDNDFFMPVALTQTGLTFNMVLYDRSGTVVYTTRNANDPWDGVRIDSREMAREGEVYVWVVRLVNEKGNIEEYSQTLNIVK
jgi:gliding motility-associated-like protein